MKRIFYVFLIAVLIMSFDGVLADNAINLIVNGEYIESDEKPRIEKGIIIIQAKPVLEALGYKYKNTDSKKLSIEAENASLVITAGSTIVEKTKDKF